MRVLICDDEELIRWSVSEHLQQEGHQAITAEDGEDGLRKFEEQGPDAVILDLKMPKLDGLSVLRQIRTADQNVPVVVITAHGAVDSAIEATRLGASAYLSKPFDLRELSLQLDRAVETARVAREVHYLRGEQRAGYHQLVGVSKAMQGVFDTLARLEAVDGPTVLITGESGTGKELVAQAIHARGPRAQEPFMAVDCASLPEQLIESELFGHERGSFTDAKQQKRGLFEAARGGTIFLDEIGEMPIGTQAKLLRALENRAFRRVGGVVDLPLDAAVVAATNRDLKQASADGTFREDLYFRLNVIPIELPPLRKRPEDIGPIVDMLLKKITARMPHQIDSIDGEALACLKRYRWPGNVRELRNVIERAVILHHNADVIRREHLPDEVQVSPRALELGDCPFELPEDGVDLEAVEAGLIRQALERAGGNKSQAARLLKISRYTLRYRMEKYGLG